MSDPNLNATTEDQSTAANTGTSEQPAGTAAPTTDVALSGVTGTATAGDLSTASSPSPEPQQQVDETLAQAAAAGLPTTDPVVTEGGNPASMASDAGGAQPPAAPPASGHTPFVPDIDGALAQLEAIERIALFWGGERGTELRNHVGHARIALVGQ